MRTIGFIGFILTLSITTPALPQEQNRDLRPATVPLTPSTGSTADASVTFAARPGALTSLRQRADAWRQQGEFEQAIAEYTRVLEVSSRDPESYFGRGWSYHRAGNISRAVDDYTEAVRLRPHWSDVYKMRAHARFAQGSPELAVADLRRAFEYAPKEVEHLTSLGVVRLHMGESDVARSNFSRALQFKDDGESMLLLYIARSRAGERATAELEANSARLKKAAWPYPLVEFYLGARSTSDTLAAAQTNEELCEAHYYIGQLHLLRKAGEAALTAFKHAALVCPKTYLEYGAATAELKRNRR
jgi:tetratricopeptide (TPR) repeat protein